VIIGSIGALAAWVQGEASPAPVVVPAAEVTSPGLTGFLVTFALALACVLLFLSLTKQLRTVSHRAASLGPVEDVPTGGPATDRGDQADRKDEAATADEPDAELP
jgi:hypothetical protein